MHQEKPNNQTILLVGGGTGGHIFPLVAIGEELAAKSIPFIYVGSENSLEERIISPLGWKFISIQAGKWRRYSTFQSIVQNIVDIFKAILGLFQAIKIIRKHKVSQVFSKGGYVALPVVFAARLLGKKIIVHESDAVMGLTNRICARVADRILTAFAVEDYPNRNEHFRQVGIPVRSSLRQAAKLKAPKKSRPLILVLPGSQGARSINTLLKQELLTILKFADVVHLTGEQDYEQFQKLKQTLPVGRQAQYKPYSFIDRELPYYFQTADLLVARGSATTIAEAALFKRAMYVIPLPTAASNHQLENAKRLENVGAAVLKQEFQLSAEEFSANLIELIQNPDRLIQIGEKLNHYFNSEQTIKHVMEEINGTN